MRSYYAFWDLPFLYVIVLCSIFGCSQSELLSPTENAAPALPEMHGLESSFYVHNLLHHYVTAVI